MIIVCPFFFFFPFAIALSVILRSTASDYPSVSSNSSYCFPTDKIVVSARYFDTDQVSR